MPSGPEQLFDDALPFATSGAPGAVRVSRIAALSTRPKCGVTANPSRGHRSSFP